MPFWSPLPPLRGEMSRSDRGGSDCNHTDGVTGGEPPSAVGISPARGEKGNDPQLTSDDQGPTLAPSTACHNRYA